MDNILWTRQYVVACCRKYPHLTTDKAASAVAARKMLSAPLDSFLKTESPDRDPTWLQSLPNEALRCFMKHVLVLSQGFFKPDIQGALQMKAGDRFSVDKFHQTTRVNQRFATAFKVAYDSLEAASTAGKTTEESSQPGPGIGGQTAASAGSKPSPPANSGDNEDKRPELSREMQLASFRSDCEEHCRRELSARLVALVVEGDHLDMRKSVAETRLSQNLTESALLMGFYDVKNARLCSIFEGESLSHREPVLDTEDVERFLATVVPLMRAGRDVTWILAGRTESNVSKLRKIIAHAGGKDSKIPDKLHSDTFYLCYNAKQMQQYGHWKRQKGLANSKSIEQLICLYRGKLPKSMPKHRFSWTPTAPSSTRSCAMCRCSRPRTKLWWIGRSET